MNWRGMQLARLKFKFISLLALFSQFSVSPHSPIWIDMTENEDIWD